MAVFLMEAVNVEILFYQIETRVHYSYVSVSLIEFNGVCFQTDMHEIGSEVGGSGRN